VHILEVQGENMPCAPGTAYLQSTAVSGAPFIARDQAALKPQ
jgi:hypothetical protein